jgi:hypothetical protein
MRRLRSLRGGWMTSPMRWTMLVGACWGLLPSGCFCFWVLLLAGAAALGR